jgi:cystathionine beta-lyase/cystathionine gamma-synthase
MSDEQRIPKPDSPIPDLSHILNHLGEERAGYHGAVAPPLVQSSIFAFPTVAEMRLGFLTSMRRTCTRQQSDGRHPAQRSLRSKVPRIFFASGAAAMAAAVFASVRGGDHVLCIAKPYSWTRGLLRDLLPKFGVSTSFVDGTDVANFENAIQAGTRLIVLESPNTMTYEQQDLAAVAVLARRHGLRTICDNSFATPLNQSPIAQGIDLVVHSATKYLNGHSDVVAGMLCGSEAILREVFKGPYMTFGAILSPHDAWLMIRGLRTLAVRMERVAASTARVLAYVEAHPKIRRVYHPQASTTNRLI